MLGKDRITPATDGHPQARKLLGTISEHQAETDVLDKLQRRPFIVDAQARQPTEAAVTLFLQRFKIIAHDVVIPSPSGFTLNQATDDWHTARVPLSGAQGLVCRREAALCSA